MIYGTKSLRLLLLLAVGLALVAVACTKEVIREIEVEREIIVEKEVIKEVPFETIVVVEKEVIKEIPVEKIVTVEKEVVRETGGAREAELKTMRFAIGQTYPNIVTHLAKSSGMSLLFDLMYSRIAMPNPNGFFEPDLAERWDIAPDASSYTFYIRKNAFWHDGVPVTANDVAFMWKKLLDPEFPSWKASQFTIVKGGRDYLDGKTKSIPGLVVVDDFTIRFDMEEPSTIFFLTCCSLRNPIYPEHIYGKTSAAEMKNHPTFTNAATPLGSGPYRWVEHISDQFALLEANPDYHFGRPKMDRILINMITQRDARQIAMMRGELDVLYHGLSPEGNAALIADPRFTVKGVQGSVVGGWGWNHDVDYLRDPRIRHAFAYAMDRPKMIRTFNTGNGIIYNSMLTHSWYQKPEWKDMFAFNPDKSRALLKEAGWDSNRVVKIMTSPPRDERGRASLAALQQMLGDVGFKIEYDLKASAEYGEAQANGDYEISGAGGSVFSDPDGFLSARFFSTGENYTRYGNPELDKMIVAGRTALDPRERAKIYQEIAEIMMRDMPYTTTYMTNSWYAMRTEVRIPHFDTIGDPTSLFTVEVAPSFTHRLDVWNYHVEEWDIDR